MEKQVFYVYVLKNPQDRIYIGQTNNLQRRLLEHNSIEQNTKKYTSKFHSPWSLIYSEIQKTRSLAMSKEKWLKSTSGRRWIHNVLVERVRHTESMSD